VNKTRTLLALAVAAGALSFALYTQHAWEDFYITYRPSKNLVEGHGLVFQPGEHVHTFTSPVNVLLPALLAFLTGNRSDQVVLWLYRVASALALGGGAALLLRTGERLGFGRAARAAMVLVLCFDAKTIDFAVNGQESGFMVFFLALTLDALTRPGVEAVRRLALAFAGLMWTRPDGFIYGGALTAAAWLFPPATTTFAGRAGLRRLATAVLLGLSLYLPWLIFSTLYYGSPIPHTVLAKQIVGRPHTLRYFVDGLLAFPGRVLEGSSSVTLTFLPIYPDRGGWDYRVLWWFGRLTGLPCALYWMLPVAKLRARFASLAFLLGHLYLTIVAPYVFPWYLPSVVVFGIVTLAAIGQEGLDLARRLEVRTRLSAQALRGVLGCAAAAMLAGAVGLLFASARELKAQQSLIEEGNRKPIGLWLKANARSPLDSVFLEPLGYIGFFSGLKMYDFPGLSSPEVVAARHRLGTDLWAPLIRDLTPDWLVLRPGEVSRIRELDPDLLRDDYEIARVFDVRPALAAAAPLPGMPYLRYDSVFVVFRRLGRS